MDCERSAETAPTSLKQKTVANLEADEWESSATDGGTVHRFLNEVAGARGSDISATTEVSRVAGWPSG